MITYFQAIVIGLLQGATELFPVSSLGHSVILPALLGWNIDQGSSFFLVFLVAVHFATALALLVFFFRDWVLIVKGFFSSFGSAYDAHDRGSAGKKYARLAWLLILGTVPAGLIGLLFQNKLQTLFASPRLVAFFLILNGLMLWAVEKMHGNSRAAARDAGIRGENTVDKNSETGLSDGRIAGLTPLQSIKVGLAQCLALIPGFSRTGATQGGGVLVGLSREDATRFAFLLATPIIFAAAALKLPQLGHLFNSGGVHILGPIFAGALCAFLAAYFSARYLVRYFKTKTLMPFAIYCMAAGIFSLFVFLIH